MTERNGPSNGSKIGTETGRYRDVQQYDILVKSYLISIYDDIPTLQMNNYEDDTDCLSMIIDNMWGEMLEYGPKPDEESEVIGHYFEAIILRQNYHTR